MMQVIDLFPIPLVVEELNFDQAEFDFAIDYLSVKNNLHENKNKNFNSVDTYILKQMPTLSKQIQKVIDGYVYNFLGEESELKITQSWLNYNPPSTSHHKHAHSNSIVSGIVYLQTDDKTGNLNLYRPENQARHLHDEIKHWHPYNYEHVYFAPKVGNMFLFPSTLSHSVEENTSTISRISLSFNTFYSGAFGSKVNLTQVPLR
jgi:uncharacterized protein (TIGR02466 family)